MSVERTEHKGVGSTSATKNEVLIMNHTNLKLVHIEVKDDGSECLITMNKGLQAPQIFISNVLDENPTINIVDNKDHINPNHYKNYPFESIEMMEAVWGTEKTITFCEMTAFKYRMRLGHKDGMEQELKKEEWYLSKANELKEKLKAHNGGIYRGFEKK